MSAFLVAVTAKESQREIACATLEIYGEKHMTRDNVCEHTRVSVRLTYSDLHGCRKGSRAPRTAIIRNGLSQNSAIKELGRVKFGQFLTRRATLRLSNLRLVRHLCDSRYLRILFIRVCTCNTSDLSKSSPRSINNTPLKCLYRHLRRYSLVTDNRS